MMESFRHLIDERIKSAKPLSQGVGLYRQKIHRPTIETKRHEPELFSPQSSLRLPAQNLPMEETVSALVENLETLKAQAEEVATVLSTRPWLAQAMDVFCVSIIFLMFPMVTLQFEPRWGQYIFSPTVVFLFLLLYWFFFACYLWSFHYLDTPTLGMKYQHMNSWPRSWKWNRKRFFPALFRTIGHITLDSAWRRSRRTS